MHNSSNITRCETDFSALLDSMRAAPGGEGVTAEEIADTLSMSVETVRKRLRRALELGLVRRTKKRIIRLDGNPTTVPSYAICDSERSVTMFPEQVRL